MLVENISLLRTYIEEMDDLHVDVLSDSLTAALGRQLL